MLERRVVYVSFVSGNGSGGNGNASSSSSKSTGSSMLDIKFSPGRDYLIIQYGLGSK